ncbi:hypothetical protein ACHQM5_022790 [Ranunculus cassubicifolius]
MLPGRSGSAFLAEVMAVWLALFTIIQLQLDKVIIQMDSQFLYKILTTQGSEIPIMVATQIYDILQWKTMITDLQFQWKYRACNMVADAIAKKGLTQAQQDNWWESPIIVRPSDHHIASSKFPVRCSYWSYTPPAFLHNLLLGDFMHVNFSRQV